MTLYKTIAPAGGLSERVECSPEEEAIIRAEWAATAAKAKYRLLSTRHIGSALLKHFDNGGDKSKLDLMTVLLLSGDEVIPENDPRLLEMLTRVGVTLREIDLLMNPPKQG